MLKLRIVGSSQLLAGESAGVQQYRISTTIPLLEETTICWLIPKGEEHVQVLGGQRSSRIRLKGVSTGKVTLLVRVTYREETFTNEAELLVTEPTSLHVLEDEFQSLKGGPYGYLRLLKYQVLDHLGNPLKMTGINITEEMNFQNVEEQSESTIRLRMRNETIGEFPLEGFSFGRTLTDQSGRFEDRLRLANHQPLPEVLEVVIQQTIRANGIIVCTKLLTYTQNGVSVTELEQMKA